MEIPLLAGTVDAEEWQLRCHLAACYRLVALYGRPDLIFTHINARLSGAGAALSDQSVWAAVRGGHGIFAGCGGP